MTKKTVNVDLIKQAVLTKQANRRQATSATKTRGMVSGGGKKPWRQKGTGRARVGSSRSPIWVGGGKVFGPHKDRNYKTRLPKKMQEAAFAEILELHKDKIKSVASLALKEPKTKLALALLKDNGLDGKILLVTEKMQPELVLATNNLPNVKTIVANELSVLHFLGGITVVMEEAVFTSLFPNTKTAKTETADKPKKATTKKSVAASKETI